MPSKEFNLDAFLKKAQAENRTCWYCRNKKAADALEAWLDKKAAGETHISANFMLERCFVPIFGAPKSPRSFYKHIQICLGRDLKTGKRHGEA